MADDRRISLLIGDGGWVRVGWYLGGDYLLGYARFEAARGGKWRISAAYFPEPTAEWLRSFPLGRVEIAVNASPVLAKSIAESEPAETLDVPAMFRGRPRGGMLLDRPRLERPAGKRLGGDFFQRVAEAYQGALADGLNPRQTLARDSGSAPDTVARWVKEARRRGYLPETTSGRVSKP